MLVNGKHFHKMFQIHWVCGIQNTVTFFEDNTFLSQLQRIKTPFKSKKICDIWKLSLFPSIRMLHLHLYHSCYMAEVQVFMNADLFPLQIFSIGSEQPESAVTKVWLCSFVETALWLLWPLFTCLFIAPLTAFLTFVTTPFGNLASGMLKYLSLLILPFIFSPHFLRWCTNKQTF